MPHLRINFRVRSNQTITQLGQGFPELALTLHLCLLARQIREPTPVTVSDQEQVFIPYAHKINFW
jgi:hypothetical protein